MDELARPIFIIGSPRSGTSILTWSLGQHPNILPLEETYWIAKLAVALGPIHKSGAARGARSQLSAAHITKGEFHRCFARVVDHLIRHYENQRDHGGMNEEFKLRRSVLDPKARWVDGTPENSLYINALSELFPAAKFIHILRDVQSVVKSLMNFANLGVANFSEQAAYEKWTKMVRACVQAEGVFGPDKVHRIKYSDLVDAPEAVLRSCLDFVEEPFCSDCLKPLKSKINSSMVPSDFNPYDPSTVPGVREEAERLSRDLLQEAWPARQHQKLIDCTRELACASLPHNATVLVVSKGDDRLLELGGPKGWHFPQDLNGDYTGHHPADSAEAIAHLEALRAKGGEFLLFPSTAFWWLDFYEDFRRHLDTRYGRVWGDDHCIIFQLSPRKLGNAEMGCPTPT
jgi:hypothetical protein